MLLVITLKFGLVRIAIAAFVNSNAVVNLCQLVFISLYSLVQTILYLSNCK